jgi:hypothetical protein
MRETEKESPCFSPAIAFSRMWDVLRFGCCEIKPRCVRFGAMWLSFDFSKMLNLNPRGCATPPRATGLRRQGKLPGFRDEILAEAVVAFFLNHAKSSLLVNVPRGIELALRPLGKSRDRRLG